MLRIKKTVIRIFLRMQRNNTLIIVRFVEMSRPLTICQKMRTNQSEETKNERITRMSVTKMILYRHRNSAKNRIFEITSANRQVHYGSKNKTYSIAENGFMVGDVYDKRAESKVIEGEYCGKDGDQDNESLDIDPSANLRISREEDE